MQSSVVDPLVALPQVLDDVEVREQAVALVGVDLAVAGHADAGDPDDAGGVEGLQRAPGLELPAGEVVALDRYGQDARGADEERLAVVRPAHRALARGEAGR